MKKLTPVFLLYLLEVVVFSSPALQGDESGYLNYATHLSQGTPPETLWWGPGYPIVLLIVVVLRLPLMVAKVLNACFLFGALIYFKKTLSLYVQEKYALIGTLLLGLYPPFMRAVHLLLTESLVFLLICGFTFHFCKLHKSQPMSRSHLVLASGFLGYLALTKVFFGYAILVGAFLSCVAYVWRRHSRHRRTLYTYFLAVTVCLPYLLYTYYLTGEPLYWGSSGGMSLYWMSTPYKNEFGDWFYSTEVRDRPELMLHRPFFDHISHYSEIEQDRELKNQAITNILDHPGKYFINWTANIGRLLFSYPFSYTQQKLSTYFYLLPNMFLFVLLTLSLYAGVRGWQAVPYELGALLSFGFVSFGGLSLLSAYERQFRPLVPILVLWLVWVRCVLVRIEIRRRTSPSDSDKHEFEV